VKKLNFDTVFLRDERGSWFFSVWENASAATAVTGATMLERKWLAAEDEWGAARDWPPLRIRAQLPTAQGNETEQGSRLERRWRDDERR